MIFQGVHLTVFVLEVQEMGQDPPEKVLGTQEVDPVRSEIDGDPPEIVWGPPEIGLGPREKGLGPIKILPLLPVQELTVLVRRVGEENILQ